MRISDWSSDVCSSDLQLLLEFSQELPAVPPEYEGHPEMCERVVECQSPVYIIVDVDADDRVAMHATAPAEAPTTRGFASILVQGISGLSADEVLGIPDDFPQRDRKRTRLNSSH